MSIRLAILCPGQGAQHAQMFAFACGTQCEELFRSWKLQDRLGIPVDAALADKEAIFSNRVAQPLIVAAAMATWKAISDVVPQPALVAGYSIGEVSAYGIAGALPAEDAIGLAATRARMMDECIDTSMPQGMLAISGLGAGRSRRVVEHAGCHVAIETGEDSLIAGGLQEAVSLLQQQVQSLGGHACMLPLGVASHTPLMREAVERFHEELDRSRLSDPHVPVLSGVSAQRIHRREDAISCLASQIAETIRWAECMDACAEAGITAALELGPGTALSRMMQARHPHIACRSVAEFKSVAGLGAWIARQ